MFVIQAEDGIRVAQASRGLGVVNKRQGCHVTGLITVGQNEDGEWLGEEGEQFSEYNIGCEACHGPGSDHIAGPSPENIVNPEDLSQARRIEVCGRCHSRGTSTAGTHGYPWYEEENRGFTPGDILSQYYRENAGYWPDGTSKKHHQQYIDMKRSHHYAAGMYCADCHDPHGGDYEFDLRYDPDTNEACTVCHWTGTGTVLTNHTRHPSLDDGEGSLCVDCHMPKVAKSAIHYDISSHLFEPLEPELTLEYQMPNSCAIKCHRDNEYGEGAVDEDLDDWSSDADMTIATWAQSYVDQWFHSPEPSFQLGCDQDVYSPGDQMTVFISARNPGETLYVDLYIALEFAGAFYFFPNWTTDLNYIPVTMAKRLELHPTPFIQWPLSDAIPDGTYNWYGILTESGTTNLVGDVSITPWTFTAGGAAASGDLPEVLEDIQLYTE